MDGVSLGKLSLHFSQKISKLELAALLLSGIDGDEFRDVTDNIEQEVHDLEGYLKQLCRSVQEQRYQLEDMEELNRQASQMVEHLQHALDNVPHNLPAKKPKTIVVPDVGAQNLQKHFVESVQPLDTNCCHFLQFLTVDDYEAVPKYMKGRLTYEKINSVIKQLDNVYVAKYKILKQKKSTLNDQNRKRYEAFKLQENKDTKAKGSAFIVEGDIADFATVKIDKATRNILTILRHCSFMHEIRGEGYVRFAAYPGY